MSVESEESGDTKTKHVSRLIRSSQERKLMKANRCSKENTGTKVVIKPKLHKVYKPKIEDALGSEEDVYDPRFGHDELLGQGSTYNIKGQLIHDEILGAKMNIEELRNLRLTNDQKIRRNRLRVKDSRDDKRNKKEREIKSYNKKILKLFGCKYDSKGRIKINGLMCCQACETVMVDPDELELSENSE